MENLNSYLLVNTGYLRSNIRTILKEISARAPGSSLIPVLKDDAYGLGLEQIAETAAEFDEIQFLACAHISEGLRIRNCGIQKDILILGNPVTHLIPAAIRSGLILTLSRSGIVEDISEAAVSLGINEIPVSIEIDSGLHRTGLMPGEELSELIRSLKECRNISFRIVGIYSHFSNPGSEKYCEEENRAFSAGVAQLSHAGITAPLCHISSSASFEQHPEYSMDAVRIGRRLYMDAPSVSDGSIREIASWRAFITGIYHREKGSALGYGKKTVLEKDSDIAVISVGYGDGLDLQLSECHAPVLAGGMRCPILACFMDQAIIDITGCDVAAGSEVTLFGYDKDGNYLSSQELALMIGDNEGCGLYSGISARVERRYI